jgi:hypothetical protein
LHQKIWLFAQTLWKVNNPQSSLLLQSTPLQLRKQRTMSPTFKTTFSRCQLFLI